MILYMTFIYLMTCLSCGFLIWRVSKVRPEFCPFLSQGLVISWMFLAGLTRHLDLGTLILKGTLIGVFFFLFVASFFSMALRIKCIYFLKANKVFIFLILASPLIFADQFVGVVDELMCWAGIIKEMTITHGLLDGSSTVYYRNYRPGMSLFYYFFLYGGNFSEPLLYMAAFYLSTSAIHCVFARFNRLRAPTLAIFFILSWIAFKILGLGVKNLIADQLMMCSYFACLLLIFIGGTRAYLVLLFPFFELSMAKQFGNHMAYSLIVILFAKHLDILRSRRSPLSAYFRLGGLSLSMFIATSVFSSQWDRWVIQHGMSGLFFSSINSSTILNYFKNIFHTQLPLSDRIITQNFFKALLNLPVIMNGTTPPSELWNISTYFLILIGMVGIISFRKTKRHSSHFNLRMWLLLFATLAGWLLGLLLLNILVFSKTSEPPFPSLGRYLCIFFTPIFLLASYLLSLDCWINFKGIRRYFGVSALIIFILMAPNTNGFILSSREQTYGLKEREMYSTLRSKGKLTLKSSDTVCFLFEGSDLPVYHGAYEILPAHGIQLDPISSARQPNLKRDEKRCTHVLGYCDSLAACRIAGERFPREFDRNSQMDLWLRTWNDFAATDENNQK